ncbi:helix-turn-helix transcriptional regulator [Glaciihabitans sp. UYNi722]|uniref:helix-turn-helix transcriptional regulator n=1 Tax=Glaciihabitans sp. UYNi722 TaxID=3156344 RepID=UPI0033943D70
MEEIGRPELGEFLRHRRALMTPPTRSGNERTSVRRVPGLRRQELSEVAGISVEYYTRLEQSRAPRPSREVLYALGRAFGLSSAERDHLFRLAGELPPEPQAPSTAIRPGILQLLDGLDSIMPVTVHDGRLDLLAANVAALEMLSPLISDGPFGRNIVYQCFTSTALHQIVGADGAEQLARVATSELRTALTRYPNDDYLQAVFQELSAISEGFRARWEDAEVGTWRSATKSLHHPTRGWLNFESEMLHDPENDHWIMLYTPQ